MPELTIQEINIMYDEILALRKRVKELEAALRIAANAVEIASDWHLPAVQVDPPKEWGLEGGGEDPGDGWCSTSQLAAKLNEIATEAAEKGVVGDEIPVSKVQVNR